jgi:hypothetical protein
MSEPRACLQCLRRSQLFAHLAPYIEQHLGGEPGPRLLDLLSLG